MDKYAERKRALVGQGSFLVEGCPQIQTLERRLCELAHAAAA